MKKLMLLALFLSAVTGFSQLEVRGEIRDSKSGEVIPYTNIYLKNHPIGTTAYRGGNFNLKLDSLYSDSLIFSIIGYRPKSVFLPDVIDQKMLLVSLEPVAEELDAVEVRPREMKILELGLVKNRATHQTGSVPQKPSARFIPNALQLEGFIKNVAVYISKKGVPEAPFRVNILSVNKVTGAPDKPLIKEGFIARAEKGNEWVTIDLKKKLIPLPNEGIFVAVQPLPIDSVQMIEYRTKYPEITEKWMRVSAPQFGYRWEKYERAAKTNWSYGWTEEREWRPLWRDLYIKLDSSRNVVAQRASSIMVKAEISYYADQVLKVKELKTKRAIKKVFDRPKENTLEYPQSSPGYLMASLKKAVEQDDFAYMCSYLLYYEDEEELEEAIAFVAAKKNETDSVLFSQKEKDEMITTLTELEKNLDNLKATEGDRFIFELEHEGAAFYFQNKNGAWKIGPKSSRLVEPTRDVKSMKKF